MGVHFDQMPGVVWFDGKLVPNVDAKIHVLTHGLHYASAVFEGERAYAGTIYKCTEHSERLHHSAGILDFEIPFSVAEIDAAKRLVVEKNKQPNAYIRAIAWRGSEQLGVAAMHNAIHLAIATWEWPSYFDPAQRAKGIRLAMADYRRPDPRTAPALAKASALYAICTIEKHKAERAGYADAMMLDWQERVAECTGANIFFIKDGKIHTPIADCFLDGITRRSAIMLAKRRGIEVIERRILPSELDGFSECFITGTAAEITAVSEIAHWRFTPSAITLQLADDYTAEVQPKGNAAAA
jgi:branched-chain amino acid aminotransferase